jgi:hypothetical protein
MMGATTRLHADKARWKFCHQVDQRVPPNPPPQDDDTGCVQADNTAHVLAEIDAKHCNLHEPLLRLNLRQDYLAEGGAGHSINFPARVAEIRKELAPSTSVEVWFQDEMRVGQKNKITYRWARTGSRPRADHDQRTQSAYLFGAVCPERGTGAALVLPACNTQAMQLHLDEIATEVAPGAHAILILDQAGWHGAKDLRVPRNISLLPLPPRSPELNPQENIWQFMRQNWLSNRVFQSFDDILDHCCYAWRTLINQPWKIMSIARRDWATDGQSI